MNSTIPPGDPGGLVTPLSVSIPAGEAITSVSVLFNILHPFTEDLIINLKAPNGQVLNLVNRRGTEPSNDNFLDTVISSRATDRLSAGTSPYTGTFRPDAVVGVGPTTAISTASYFFPLYSQPSGLWFLGIRDVASSNAGVSAEPGILTNWSITVNYGIAPAQTDTVVTVESAVVDCRT